MLRDPANSDNPLDRVMHALANPLRRELLEQIKDEPVAVSSLAEHAQITLPAMSRHLRLLEKAGLIDREKQGRVHLISLRHSQLRIAQEWLAKFRYSAALFDHEPEERGDAPSRPAREHKPPPRDHREILDMPTYEEQATEAAEETPNPPDDLERKAPDLSPEALDELLRKLNRR